MDTKSQNIEEVREKGVDLDSELDAFFQSLKETGEIRKFIENIKRVIDSHEHSIITLNDNYASILMMLERAELSIKGIQNNAFLSRKKPNEFDAKIKVMEERLKQQFFTKLEQQKRIILWMLTAFIISIVFIVSYVMYWH